jgi:hypothetical protein
MDASTQSDQAGPDPSNSDVVRNDETILGNESMGGEQIESDSDQFQVSFSTARSKHSNAIGKDSTAGPSANRNER